MSITLDESQQLAIYRVDSRRNSERSRQCHGSDFFLASRHLSTGASPSSNVTTNRKARPKQRQGCRFQRAFSGRSTRQRRHPHKTSRGSRNPKIILRTLHAPEPPPPKTARRLSIANRTLRRLHAPAPPPAQNSEKVVDTEQSSQDAPGASAAAHKRRKQREGSQCTLKLRTAPERERFDRIRTAPQRQRSDTHETRRGFTPPTPAKGFRNQRK